MINIFLLIVPTLAAVASAIATFLAWRVAYGALNFQKNLVKNKTQIETISDLIEKLLVLKTMRKLSPFEIPDEQILMIDNLLSDIKGLMSTQCLQHNAQCR